MSKILAIDCWPTQGDPNQILLSGSDTLRMIGGNFYDRTILETAKAYVDYQADLKIVNNFVELCGIVYDHDLKQEIWFARCFIGNIRLPFWSGDDPTFWYQWDTIKGIGRVYPTIEFAIPMIREAAFGWVGNYEHDAWSINYSMKDKILEINKGIAEELEKENERAVQSDG